MGCNSTEKQEILSGVLVKMRVKFILASGLFGKKVCVGQKTKRSKHRGILGEGIFGTT